MNSCDLPLELNAVGTLSGPGFHPLTAQRTLSNHYPQTVRPQGRTPVLGARPGCVASLRNASRSARWRASFIPGNVIVFPGIKCCGSLIHSSSVSSVQIMPADLSAGEQRGKLAKDPDFRFQTSDKLRPVTFPTGS